MKKKHAAFLLFGTIVLSSCANYGPEISDKTEIQELGRAISARMNEIKGYELVGKKRSCSKDNQDERLVNYITDAVYRVDQKGNQYLSVADDLDGTKYYEERYEVTDAKYGKVLYCEDPYDFDPDHYAAYILDDMKPVNSEGSIGFWTHGGNFVTPFIKRFSQVRDPLNFDGSFFFRVSQLRPNIVPRAKEVSPSSSKKHTRTAILLTISIFELLMITMFCSRLGLRTLKCINGVVFMIRLKSTSSLLTPSQSLFLKVGITRSKNIRESDEFLKNSLVLRGFFFEEVLIYNRQKLYTQ